MGKYLDALTAQFDEITTGIDEILDRAADEGRDVTKDEQELINRDRTKADELKKSIDYYSELEVQRGKVAEARGRVPQQPRQTSTAVVVERDKDPDKEIVELFPTMGDYIVTVARALRGDKAAGELIQRATAHQTTADNPGLLPRPIVGPVITAVANDRPFLASIPNKRLPINNFDRPIITQHLAVGKQAAEKDLTASQVLKVGKLPVSAETFAGHLNISLQDIRWTQPGIMQIVAEDFIHRYAVETDKSATEDFVASVTNAAIAAELTGAGVTSALFEAAAANMSVADGAPLPDTLWVAPDIWGALGSLVNNYGAQIFPSVTPTSATGNPLGVRLIVDAFFPAGTAIVGPSRFLEWYEDVAGLMQVAEPDMLGQLVGYAGFGAFLNTKPELFTPLTLTAPAPALAAAKTAAK
ncbi:hypothetical protein IF188_09635 [Microbacterium sp. NEAU-LLC]|uniref:Phage major capsid protein n=1 Tax=Microbacterium helvum TaxID=2773713 RepID=A0ABR8NMS5_9MICO|nr:hypothetical protein [Microbacterium helvum]MBD3941955.1 hypothetical protein [Microbacterium helvum]